MRELIRVRYAIPALALAALSACTAFPTYRDTSVPMTSMAVFDPARYTGVWYEIASYEAPFQKGCEDTAARYTTRPDGLLDVLNQCTKYGEITQIAGDAELVGPGRLKVSLDGVPFAADYWVLWVDDDYRTAVVGVPSGRAGWILSRTPDLPEDRLNAARDVLTFNGYSLDDLKMTPQSRQE